MSSEFDHVFTKTIDFTAPATCNYGKSLQSIALYTAHDVDGQSGVYIGECPMRELILVTGSMRAGKTSFCKALFQILDQKLTRPFAIIEENLRDGRGIPLSIVLHDLSAKEETPLASRKPAPAPSSGESALGESPGGVSPGGVSSSGASLSGASLSGASLSADYPPFDFRPEAFTWAEDRLREAVEQGCGPVILDETGALEAKRGGGFLMAAAWAMGHGEGSLILTLRPEFAGSLLERLSSITETGSVKRFQLGEVEPDKLASAIADDFFSGQYPAEGNQK
jgi:hypothetical protein